MRLVHVLTAMVGLMVGGCASAPVVAPRIVEVPPRIDGVPAKGSKFSKVQLGESKNQVENDIGMSKDCNISTDPENIFISNSMITTCVYKNEGTLVFRVIGNKLYRVKVNPSEGDFAAIRK